MVEEADLSRIINDLGTGEEDEVEGETEEKRAGASTRPTSGIVKLCNQIIIDGYNRGASDIHVEPYGKTAPTTRSGSASTATATKYLEVPAPHRHALVQRAQDHVEARHRREAEAPGRQDPLPRADGHDRAARRDDPDVGRQRGRGHAHPRREQAAAPREDGLLRAEPDGVQEDPREAVRHLPRRRARPARARRPPCTPRSATSTPRT